MAQVKQRGFWGRVIDKLAPPENRELAVVAFARTFRQGFTGSAIAAAGGGITLTAAGIGEVNVVTVGYAAIAVGIASTGAALTAYFNVLENGLNRKYTEAVVSTLANDSIADTRLATAMVEAAQNVQQDAADLAKK